MSDCFATGPVSKQRQVLTGVMQSHGNSFRVLECALCLCVCACWCVCKNLSGCCLCRFELQGCRAWPTSKHKIRSWGVGGGGGDPARLFCSTNAHSYTKAEIFIIVVSLWGVKKLHKPGQGLQFPGLICRMFAPYSLRWTAQRVFHTSRIKEIMKYIRRTFANTLHLLAILDATCKLCLQVVIFSTNQ